jgi:hypothetical protein
VAIKLTAIQLIPFFLSISSTEEEELLLVVEDLMPMIGDKQGLLSSWAMIACARYDPPITTLGHHLITQPAVRLNRMPKTGSHSPDGNKYGSLL